MLPPPQWILRSLESLGPGQPTAFPEAHESLTKTQAGSPEELRQILAADADVVARYRKTSLISQHNPL